MLLALRPLARLDLAEAYRPGPDELTSPPGYLLLALPAPRLPMDRMELLEASPGSA